MNRIEPLAFESLTTKQKEWLDLSEGKMGFRTNAGLTFARVPGLLESLDALTWTIYGRDGLVGNDLKRLVAIVVSTAAGCTYCRAHTTHGASSAGIAEEKVRRVWEYETCDLFSDAERAALRVAQGAAQLPVCVEDSAFIELKRHYDDDQICEIVSVMCLFGFLNRWHATLATDLEPTPLASLHLYGTL